LISRLYKTSDESEDLSHPRGRKNINQCCLGEKRKGEEKKGENVKEKGRKRTELEKREVKG
jgi:hypothetical protein